MRILCTADSGRILSEKHFGGGGYTSSSTFDLTLGKEYIVYGISLWRGLLLYLIVGEGLRPAWYPSALFEVTRRDIPAGWYFVFFGQTELELNALWGYDELVNTEEHFDDLSNLELSELPKVMAKKIAAKSSLTTHQLCAVLFC